MKPILFALMAAAFTAAACIGLWSGFEANERRWRAPLFIVLICFAVGSCAYLRATL